MSSEKVGPFQFVQSKSSRSLCDQPEHNPSSKLQPLKRIITINVDRLYFSLGYILLDHGNEGWQNFKS